MDSSLTPECPRIQRAWFQRLKLKCEHSQSNCAFNFNLRLCLEAAARSEGTGSGGQAAERGKYRKLRGPAGWLRYARARSASAAAAARAERTGLRDYGTGENGVRVGRD